MLPLNCFISEMFIVSIQCKGCSNLNYFEHKLQTQIVYNIVHTCLLFKVIKAHYQLCVGMILSKMTLSDVQLSFLVLFNFTIQVNRNLIFHLI